MKHLNNPLKGRAENFIQSEYNQGYKSKSYKKEHLPVILLICLGVAGTLYLFNLGYGNKIVNRPSMITSNLSTIADVTYDSNSAKENKPLQGNISSEAPPKNQVLIKGEMEAEQYLTFSIESFDDKAKYDLHLGDGEILHPTKSSIKYAYKRPGNYHVQLFAKYGGKSANLFSEHIQIAKAIVIAPGSNQEY